MKKDKILSILLMAILIVTITIEVGVTIGYYMLSNINYNEFNINYDVSIINK